MRGRDRVVARRRGVLHAEVSEASGAHRRDPVAQSKDKEAQLRELGADEVVPDGAGLKRAGGADVILATSNSFAAVTDCIQALRPDGRVVLMGGEGGTSLSVPTSLLWVRGRVIGSLATHPAD